MTDYVFTDERQDVLASLDHCVLSLIRTRESGGAWKWVVLSLHSALQGAMVCHLSGTAQLGALSESSAKQWLESYEEQAGAKLSSERVADAPELFSRLGDSEKRIESQCGAVLRITEAQRQSFRRLNSLRNGFTHFHPKGWSIEVDFIRTIISDALDVLAVVVEDPWPAHVSKPTGRLELEIARDWLVAIDRVLTPPGPVNGAEFREMPRFWQSP